jgi:uncharacterized protein YdhG (YjbR/CyaY superfamily)
MAGKRPTTIAGYIKAAPRAGQPHLRTLHALLESVAPHAQQVLKWNTPFFVEPRFLFGFSAHKSHLSFAPTATTLKKYRRELAAHDTTKMMLRIPYDQPLPEELLRKLARACVEELRLRKDDSFW